MKNITEILSEFGLTVPEEHKEAFTKAVNENYKTIADYEKQATKLKQATESIETYKSGMAKFDGVDLDGMKKQLEDLRNEISSKDTAHAQEIADLTFNTAMDNAIRNAHGKNAKAIRALLDVDTLKASKNQDEDIKAALDSCKADNDYLFESESAPPYSQNAGNNGPHKYDPQTEAIRSAAGLPID